MDKGIKLQKTNSIDQAILEALDHAVKDIEKTHPQFATKFKRRVGLKITGSFLESDLVDLVNDVPISDEGNKIES